jgi:hypothetical protein
VPLEYKSWLRQHQWLQYRRDKTAISDAKVATRQTRLRQSFLIDVTLKTQLLIFLQFFIILLNFVFVSSTVESINRTRVKIKAQTKKTLLSPQ